MVDNALTIASFVTGILLGLFLLGILTRRVGQARGVRRHARGHRGRLVRRRSARSLACPWYALVGSSTVFVVGLAASYLVPSPRLPRPEAGAEPCRRLRCDDGPPMKRSDPRLAVSCCARPPSSLRGLARGRPAEPSASTRRGWPGSTRASSRPIADASRSRARSCSSAADGKIAYAKAFGHRAVEPAAEPMTRDTIFDMASLTKPVATATSVMILIEQGKLRLDDRLGTLLPEFDNHGKGAITVEQLLRHRSGLIADNPLGDYADGPDDGLEAARRARARRTRRASVSSTATSAS